VQHQQKGLRDLALERTNGLKKQSPATGKVNTGLSQQSGKDYDITNRS
jgi:hypothetical protein